MMKKQLLLLVMTLLPMVAMADGIVAKAHDFEALNAEGKTIYYIYNNGSSGSTVSVSYRGSSYADFDEYRGDIVIPESVTYNGTTYKVTSIAAWAFHDCLELTSISIPHSVTRIGYEAFRMCISLTSITIPNSVTEIESYAFAECSFLTSVDIPNSVMRIGEGAFKECFISKVHISDLDAWLNVVFGDKYANPLYYAHHLFLNGEEIKDLVITDGITKIKNLTFVNCTYLTSVKIPNSLTSIGNYAFLDCSGLTSLTIPNSVTSIGGGAFSGCSGLTSLTIPNSVTSIGYGAFSGCTGLTSLTIPNSVTRIENSAFSGCSGLTSVTIPNSVTSIGGSAFYGCSNLTSVTIPNSVTSIESSAFSGCSSLTSLSIGENVTSIGEYAFSNCTGLTMIESFNPNPPQCPQDNTFYNVDFTIPLYIPSGSYLKYKAAVGWRQFVIMRELGGDSDIFLSINDGSHGNVNIKIDENNPCMTLKFESDNGWHLYSVKLNDENVTAEVGQDGKYTTPAINTNSKLVVVYAQGASSAPSINSNRIDISSNDNELIVRGTTYGERIAVYTTNGVCVNNTVATGNQTTIPLVARQTYIVKVGDLVLKYRY